MRDFEGISPPQYRSIPWMHSREWENNGPLFCQLRRDSIRGVTKDPRPFDADLCVRGIQKGLRHLHNLGLIHCDVNPTNVRMEGDTPIIVDFDSCRREGEELGLKAGTRGWKSEDFKLARRENDQYGLSKIKKILFQVERSKDYWDFQSKLLE
jgi:serine/threonine protein kinase